MLVGPHDGGVDQHAADVGEGRLGGQGHEQPPQGAGADPAAETVVDGVPAAELRGQVAPRDAGAGQVQQGLEEGAFGQARGLAAAVAFGL